MTEEPTGLAKAAAAEGERVARRGRIREVVFGAQDGLLSTLALVTGVRGADQTRFAILVAGFAGALSGTISMALGAYIATKSQRDVFANELENERRQLAERPHVEVIGWPTSSRPRASTTSPPTRPHTPSRRTRT